MHRSTAATLSLAAAAAPPPSTATRNSNLDDNVLPDDLAAAFANCDDADFEDFDWGTTNAAITAAATTTDDDINWGTATTVSGSNNADESFGTFFRNDNELDNYEWGSAARNSQTANTSATFRAAPAAATFGASPAAKRTRVDADVGAQAAPTGEVPKCTGCHQLSKQLSVKKEGPNKGRLFFVCPKPNACKFFQWADELSEAPAQSSQNRATAYGSQTHNTQSSQANEDAVKCGCGNIANSLTVRKEGPNVGRPFYACSNRDKSCGFFQWADEDQQASTSTGARQNNQSRSSIERYGSSASRSNFTSLNNKRTNDTSETKKRKCGLCRQEGHTKSKCPRKAEFEF